MFIRDEARDEEVQINLMPLLDMVFLLLIFFLVASTFSKQERQIAINLPTASREQAMSAPPKQLVLSIDASGGVTVAGKAVEGSALETLLKESLGEDKDRVVFIRADEHSEHGAFAAVVRICREAGVKQLKIGYAVEEASEGGR